MDPEYKKEEKALAALFHLYSNSSVPTDLILRANSI